MTWKPIKTAPKDGTQLLLWSSGPSHADYYIGQYETGEIGEWDTPAGWYSDDGSDIDPSHWMPLPKPPVRRAPDPSTTPSTSETQGGEQP